MELHAHRHTVLLSLLFAYTCTCYVCLLIPWKIPVTNVKRALLPRRECWSIIIATWQELDILLVDYIKPLSESNVCIHIEYICNSCVDMMLYGCTSIRCIQVLGGVLSTTSSPKAVLGLGALAWSICTVATPSAADRSFLALLLCRFAMGVGEGVALPTIQNIVGVWVAPQQRSKALGTIFSGLQLGTVVALLTAPPLIRSNGWESVFYLYGGLGILWGVLWMLLARDKPQVRRSAR